ncbi:MAG TPA: ferredoxin [Dehalococcoidales bacterium]
MKVKVDRDLCVGIGNCVAVAPTVFKLDNENKVIILDIKSASEQKVMSAIESCPVGALIAEDDQGNQTYP